MITKLASLFYSGAQCFTEKNSKGYNTAEFELVVGSGGSVNLSFLATKDGNSPQGTDIIPYVYNSAGDRVLKTTGFTEGTYVFYIDLSATTNFRIIKTGSEPASAKLNLRQAEFVVPTRENNDIFTFTSDRIIDVSNVDMLDVTVTISNKTANVNAYCYDYEHTSAIPLFVNNGIVNDTAFMLIHNGTFHFKADCRKCNSVIIRFTSCDFECTAEKKYNYTPFEELVIPELLTSTNQYYDIEGDGKQLDMVVKGEGIDSTYNIYVQGTTDGVTYDNLPSYIVNKNNYRGNPTAAGLAITVSNSRDTIFANVEGYKKLRVYFVGGQSNIFRDGLSVTIEKAEISKEYVNGRMFTGGFQTINADWDKVNKLFIGYKYFKIKFHEKTIVNNSEITGNVKDCTSFIGVYKNGSDILRAGRVGVYDRGMNVISPTVQNHIYYKLCLCGTPVDGGYILGIDESAEGIAFVPNITESRTGYSNVVPFTIECFTEKPEPEKYLEKVYEKNDYDVYKLPSDNKNRDVLNNDVVEWTSDSITFWHGGYLGIKYVIPFDENNIAHYKGGAIKFVYLLPFVGVTDRGVDKHQGRMSLPSRMVVFTKRQVFHNYPLYGDNSNMRSDLQKFDESTIYNEKKRWLPVNDKTLVASNRKYFPVLADYDYAQFDGRVNGTTGFVDPYDNDGLPAGQLLQDTLVTIDNADSNTDFWERLTYSSMTKTTKMCVFGNYNCVPGSEPIVMITDNGGKTWYVKSYFACTDDYPQMRGGKIDLKPITDVAPYVANSLKMCRKRFNLPTAAVKEPSTPFVVDTNDQSLVTGFSTDANGNCIVTVADDVDYNGIYPIVYFENVSANSEWNYICNNGFTADGETNNGIFFRVEKISANQYRLYGDLGNPYEGDMVCRHIHAVNGVEAGVLISTGESYFDGKFEGGFLYLLVENEKNGEQSWDMNYVVQDTIRLCSSKDGVNRASGAYLFSDNADPTLLYVSDESFPPNLKRSASIDGRTVDIPITPAGIFVGKLSEIDDQTKYRCVCELHTTIVGLTQANGHFAADGHGNSIMFSKDGFNWNIDVDDLSKVNGFDNLGNIYFGNKVAVFK